MDQETPITVSNNHQKESALKVGIVTATIVALCSIAFGVYGLVDGNKKSQQIADLKAQIEKLESSNPVSTDSKMVLKIGQTSWSGWSEDYEPELIEEEYDVVLNKEYVIKTRQLSDTDGNEWEEEVLSFEITSIDDDSITIHTNQVFSDKEEGIDLNTNKQDFTITVDELLTLTTPTMDEGDIFNFTLTKE